MNINGIRLKNNTEAVLCGNKICCPTLKKLPDGRYLLTDDDGNSVILTKEQAQLMSNGVAVLENNEQLICG